MFKGRLSNIKEENENLLNEIFINLIKHYRKRIEKYKSLFSDSLRDSIKEYDKKLSKKTTAIEYLDILYYYEALLLTATNSKKFNMREISTNKEGGVNKEKFVALTNENKKLYIKLERKENIIVLRDIYGKEFIPNLIWEIPSNIKQDSSLVMVSDEKLSAEDKIYDETVMEDREKINKEGMLKFTLATRLFPICDVLDNTGNILMQKQINGEFQPKVIDLEARNSRTPYLYNDAFGLNRNIDNLKNNKGKECEFLVNALHGCYNQEQPGIFNPVYRNEEKPADIAKKIKFILDEEERRYKENIRNIKLDFGEKLNKYNDKVNKMFSCVYALRNLCLTKININNFISESKKITNDETPSELKELVLTDREINYYGKLVKFYDREKTKMLKLFRLKQLNWGMIPKPEEFLVEKYRGDNFKLNKQNLRFSYLKLLKNNRLFDEEISENNIFVKI